MAYNIELPDGSIVEDIPDSVPLAEAKKNIAIRFPQFAPKPDESKSGFIPALQAGFKGLKGDVAALAGRTGVMDVGAAEKYIAEQQKQADKIFQPTQDEWSESPWKKIKELAGGSAAYMAAPALAGAATLALPASVAPAVATGIGLGITGLVSGAQFTGSGLTRQVEEGTPLAQTDLTAAALAAIPQAALDVVSLKMIPGVRGIFGAAGKKMTAEQAEAIATQGLKKTVADYALSTGTAMGAEGLTEAAQQVFERLQAGLSLTDENAQKEYLDSFLGGAILGGAIAPAGRYLERGREQREAEVVGAMPGQRPGESLADAAQRLKNEIDAEKLSLNPPAPPVDPNATPLMDKEALGMVLDSENGYGKLDNYKRALMAMPQTDEIKNSLAEVKELQAASNVNLVYGQVADKLAQQAVPEGNAALSLLPADLSTVITPELANTMGLVQNRFKNNIFNQIVGKDMSVPADVNTVRSVLESYIATAKPGDTPSKIATFLKSIPPTTEIAPESVNVGTTDTAPSGESTVVASEPGAGTPPAGVGTPESSGVVSTGEDVTGTVGGEAAAPPPVITQSAKDLLESIDVGGGTPAFMTNKLKQIAADNGIEVLSSDTPNSVIDKIRDKVKPPVTKPEVLEGGMNKDQWINSLLGQNRIAKEKFGITLDVTPEGKLNFTGDIRKTKQGKAFAASLESAYKAGATEKEIAAAIKSAPSAPVKEFFSKRKPKAAPKPKAELSEVEKQDAEAIAAFKAEGPARIAEKTEQIKNIMGKILNRMGLKDVAVKIMDDIESKEAGGSYSEKLIKIALDEARPVSTLRHEAIHALKELGFFSESQWNTLVKQAKEGWIDTYLKSRDVNGGPLKEGEKSRYDIYMERPEFKSDPNAIIEEAIADAFGDFDTNGAPPGMLKAILNRLISFFDAIKSALQGNGIYTSEQAARQVFGKIARGELKAGETKASGVKFSLKSVPNEPGTEPIPEGHVRLYHQTDKDSLEKIAKEGLLLKYARGIEGPKAIYAGETPFYRPATKSPTLEFHVPKDQWDSPFVLGDVTPDKIIAAHQPWHMLARYLEDNPKSKEQALSGKFDDLEDDYKKAVDYIKEKYKPAKLSLRAPNTKEFKQFFGDSKVVDENGEPLVMYHGTPYDFVSGRDQGVFNTKDFGALLGKGAYFTADPKDAEQYAGKTAYGKPNLIPAYISLENPLIVESVTGKIPNQAELIKQGFDGVLLKNEDGSVKWAVAFEPNQIKSATGNIGTYSKENPDIRYSLRAPDTKEFYRFFDDSKVVDEDGDPLVVYHATYSDIDKFKTTHPEDEESRFGAHFGPTEAAENKFELKLAEDKRDNRSSGKVGANMVPVFLSIQNPLRLEENRSGRWGVDDVFQAIAKAVEQDKFAGISPKGDWIDAFYEDNSQLEYEAGLTNEEDSRSWQETYLWKPGERSKILKAWLKTYGYDGIVYDNKFEGGGDSYIALYPGQIKSAIGNIGTYDRKNPDIRYSLRTIPDTKEFKQWSRDAPVIRYEETEKYKGGPAVFQAFHGTTHTGIETFDVYKGSADGALGAGSYLTTSPEDASANYAGVGPDLTARIAIEEESLSDSFNDDAYNASEMLNDYFQDNKIDNEVTDDNFDELKDEYGEKAIHHAAQKSLKGDSEGLVMPTYVRMLKPFDMRPKGLFLDYSYKTDEEGDPIDGSEQGALIDFLEAARNVLEAYGPNEFTSTVLDEAADGISAKEIFDIATKTLSNNYDDNGLVSIGHIVQEIAREAGYDGLIQDANSYFGTGRKGFGGLRVPSMVGVQEGVLHLMPFKDNQIKSAIGNQGTYSEKGNIKFSLRTIDLEKSKRMDEALRGKPYVEALDLAIKKATDAGQKSILEKVKVRYEDLKARGFEFKFALTPVNKQLTGKYGVVELTYKKLGSPTQIEMTVNGFNDNQSSLNPETLAHEFVHTVTAAQIAFVPESGPTRELYKLYDDVVTHFNEQYKSGKLDKDLEADIRIWIADPDELIAYGLTSPNAQNWLASIQDKSGKTWLSKLFDVISKVLNLTGAEKSVLARLMTVSEDIFTEELTPQTEKANLKGFSFGKQENKTGKPTWTLGQGDLAWVENNIALFTAKSMIGDKTLYVASKEGQGQTRVDIRKYTGTMFTPEELARLKDKADELSSAPETKFSLRSTWSPSMNAAIDRTSVARIEEGWAARLLSAISPKNFSEYRQVWLNRYNQLGVYDKMRADRMGGYGLLADASAEAAAMMSDYGAGLTAAVFSKSGGVPVFANGMTTVSTLNGTIKGPLEIFSELTKLGKGDSSIYRAYQLWAGVKRGKRLMPSRTNPNGTEVNYTPADIAEAKKFCALDPGDPPGLYPEFASVQKEWIKYNNQLAKYLVDTGVISGKARAEWIKYADYIPFYRQVDDEQTLGPKLFQSLTGVKPPKKLKGGSTAEVSDFLETIIRNTQSAIQMGIKNTAGQKAVNVALSLNAPGQTDVLEPLAYVSTDPNSITILVNGQKKSFKSSDRLWLQAVTSLNLPDVPFMGLFSKPAQLLRTLITKEPGFMLANMIRDSMSSYVTSGVGSVNPATTIRNFAAAIAGKSPEFQALFNAGILGGHEYSKDVIQSGNKFASDLRKTAGYRTANEKVFSPVTGLWEALEVGTTASDAATRMQVYREVLAKTGNEAEAIYRAVEVMNFNRKGNSAIVRVLTAAIPFLNARMQGLDVFYRAAFGKGTNQRSAEEIQKKFFIRGATMMAMSCMYWALTHDDDDYKKQEQETKDNYWLLPSLGIKLPIPFEVGILFKVIPERIMARTFGTDTNKDFTDSMVRQLVNTLSLNPIPQVAKPFIEYNTNYNFFTGRPIVGQGMEGVESGYQTGPNTTAIAADIGKLTGMSPLKLDHLVGGFVGTMGMYAFSLMDTIYKINGDSIDASKRFEQTPVIKRFLLDPEARGTVSAYYEIKNATAAAVRTASLLERTQNFKEWGPYMKEHGKMLATHDYILDLEKTMKDFREMKMLIRASKMDPDKKRDALLGVTKAENSLTANIQIIKKNIQ